MEEIFHPHKKFTANCVYFVSVFFVVVVLFGLNSFFLKLIMLRARMLSVFVSTARQLDKNSRPILHNGEDKKMKLSQQAIGTFVSS